MKEFDYKKYLAEGKLLKENAPGYSTRKFGESLPTLESVKAAYEAKNDIKEDDEDYKNDYINSEEDYMDRMEGLANIQDLKTMKDLLIILSLKKIKFQFILRSRKLLLEEHMMSLGIIR